MTEWHVSGGSLSNDAARRIIRGSRQNKQKPKVLTSDLEAIGDGSEGWEAELAEDVLQRLTSLKEDLLTENRSIANDQAFDRAACRIIHEGLRLPLSLVAEDGFWRWLSVDKFSEIIEARHNRTSELAGLGNFGIDASADRGRLKILWLRTDIVYDTDADDPYHLADRLSPTDFWESGIIRHYYGWGSESRQVHSGFPVSRPRFRERDPTPYAPEWDPNALQATSAIAHYCRLRISY